MCNKLKGWKQKLLTFAGREILVKVVANAIPIYPTSCFKFLKNVCMEFERMIAGFCWGQKELEGRIHWKSWKHMCKEKVEGGKTAWRLWQNPEDQWCKILKGIYFPKTSFMKARKGSKASYGWSSILEGRDLLKSNMIWKISNGKEVLCFEDNWLGESRDGCLKQRVIPEELRGLKVADVIMGGQWNLERVEGILDDEEKVDFTCSHSCDRR